MKRQRKTKGQLIEGLGVITRYGSFCMGCMGFETPYVIIHHNDEDFIWQSDYAEEYQRGGDIIDFRAFAREDPPYQRRLYKVTVKAVIKTQKAINFN